MQLTIYTVYSGERKNYENKHITLSKEKADELLEKLPNSFLKTKSSDNFMFVDYTTGMSGHYFYSDGAILLGKHHRDVQCTGTESYYSTPELEEEARKNYVKVYSKWKRNSDSYYDQPWV